MIPTESNAWLTTSSLATIAFFQQAPYKMIHQKFANKTRNGRNEIARIFYSKLFARVISLFIPRVALRRAGIML